MAERDEPAEAALRLEQALERIARLSQSPATTPLPPEFVPRLEALIAELRAALAGPSG